MLTNTNCLGFYIFYKCYSDTKIYDLIKQLYCILIQCNPKLFLYCYLYLISFLLLVSAFIFYLYLVLLNYYLFIY